MMLLILLTLLLGLCFGQEATRCSVSEDEQSSVTYLLTKMINSYNPNAIPNPSTLLALRLAKQHDLKTEKEMIKKLKEDAVSRVQNNMTFTSGTVALYVLALQASCTDQNVSGLNSSVDLVNLLQRKYNEELENIKNHRYPMTNYYQLGLDVLALCLQNVTPDVSPLLVPTDCKPTQYYLGSQFSVDIASVAFLGMTCMKDSKDLNLTERMKINSSLLCLKNKILMNRQINGIIGNIYSTGLAMQALFVSDKFNVPLYWNCNQTLYKALEEIPLGTFDNPMAASQITPALEGMTYLDVRGKNCSADQDNLIISPIVLASTSPSTNITVTYTVTDGVNKTFNDSILVTVPQGSYFLNVMEKAQEMDSAIFSFTVVSSSWGPYVTSVNGVAASNKDRTYWQLLSGTKPLEQGVGDYKPSNGESLVVKFTTY